MRRVPAFPVNRPYHSEGCIACRATLQLIDAIVDGSNAQEPVGLYFSGDNLFEPHRRRRGLPIGNLTSQFSANLYLDRFDHFLTEVLRAPYVRYVDDFALFNDNPTLLANWRGQIGRYFEDRRLKLHPRKTVILPTSEPVAFLGCELAHRLRALGRRPGPQSIGRNLLVPREQWGRFGITERWWRAPSS